MSVSNGKSCSRVARLPKLVVPVNYDLTLEPDWTTHTFEATAVIDIQVLETTFTIVLNALSLKINGISYKDSQDEVEHTAESFKVEEEVLTIQFVKALQKSEGKLTIVYGGQVGDNLKSLFRSKYQGLQGEERFHYVTYFEPTHARACFPCWDEPTIKASYDITLIVPKHLVALSNMPVKEDTLHPTNKDKKIVKFERSIKMSSYLVAIAVGEFDFVEKRTPEDDILVRVYTTVGKKEQGAYALEVALKALAFYKDYFGIPYPLPKLDLLAVAELGLGGMENFGLIIFRETVLLLDPKLSSAITQQIVTVLVTHEVAHMWFGNLVTIEWWSDLWLKEGYASFMEYFCANAIHPEFQIWNLFATDYMLALEEDAAANSHPIQMPVEDPAQIGEIFDSISYNKGASVIRMLHDFLGDDKFRKGMSLYLHRHLNGNAQTKDLWAALSESSGERIEELMSTFTEQMGYPILTVKKLEQKGDKKLVTLSYQKFWKDPKQAHECAEYKWVIPLTLRKQSDPKGVALKTLVKEGPNQDFQITVDNVGGSEWLKLNADHVGYFRVTYPSSALEQFVPSIRAKEMQPLDRLGILDDLFANVKAGYAKSVDILKLMVAYADEDVQPVWSGILNVLSAFSTLLQGTPLHANFKKYATELLTPTAKKLGWEVKENEDSQDSVLRPTIFRRLIMLGDHVTIAEAKSLFAGQARGDKSIPPDVRSAVYQAVASEGDSGLELLLKVYRSTDLLEEKMRIIHGLGAVSDKGTIEKALEFGRSGEVNMQDIIALLQSLATHGKQEVCWEYFKKNWEFFKNQFPPGGYLIRRVVNTVTADFCTAEAAHEIEVFFKEHPIPGTERTLSQALEGIAINKEWLERDYSALQDFLSSYQ